MNRALLIAMVKIHGKNILSYALGSVIYEWLVISVYPAISKSSAMNTLIQSMPSSIQKVFGMQSGIRVLGDYLGSEFYGLLFILILAAFSVTTSIQLVARMVDRGSMAYFLTTPASRAQVVSTQAVVVISGLLVICLFTTLGGICGAAIFVPHGKFDVAPFVQLNLVGFLLFAVISGFCFLCSCVFDDEKRAMGIAASFTVVEYAFHLLASLSNSLCWLKYLTVFSTFDPPGVLHGTVHVSLIGISLLFTAIVLYVTSIWWFRKRELPL